MGCRASTNELRRNQIKSEQISLESYVAILGSLSRMCRAAFNTRFRRENASPAACRRRATPSAFRLATLSERLTDRPDECPGGHDRRRPDLAVCSELHQVIGKPPEIVQQCCEREAEQPNTVVLRGRPGKKRFHRLVLIFDIPASAVAVGDVHYLLGCNVITVSHEHGIASVSFLISRWYVQELCGVVEFAINGERNIVLDSGVNSVFALDFPDCLVIVFILRHWRHVHKPAVVNRCVHLVTVESPV